MPTARELALRLKGKVPMSRRRQIAFARLAMRTPTARFRALPDFIVVGAQRCGTSSLYKYLGAHPNVMPSLRKEIEYFSTRYTNGEDWYRAHFPLEARMWASGKVRGVTPQAFEATPDYLLDPRAAARAAALLPEARILALVRNPVDRAFSHYRHNLRLGHEPLSFEEALAAEPERLEGELERLADDPSYQAVPLRRYSYTARGRYAEQLERWLDRFSPERVLVLATADLFSDPSARLAQISAFLGLPDDGQSQFLNYSYSDPRRVSPSAQMDSATRAQLSEGFRASNRRLYELVGRDFGWESEQGARL